MENLEIALLKYNKKTWFKSALLGLIIGIAVIVPGISGSTVAIIFKLYDQFLYAIGNLFKQFKKCFAFLLPIGLGVVAGFLLGFITVQQLLKINLFAIVCLFAGLMCGAFPAVWDEVKGACFSARWDDHSFIGRRIRGVLLRVRYCWCGIEKEIIEPCDKLTDQCGGE